MYYVIIFIVGLILGSVSTVIYFRRHKAGLFTIFYHEGEGYQLGVQMNNNPRRLIGKKYVTMKVLDNSNWNHISQK